MTFLPDYSVLDATLRDAGYLNNWNFSEEEIFKVVIGLGEVGVEAIEVGYLSDDTTRPLAARCQASLLSELRKVAKSSKLVAMISLSEKQPENILTTRKDVLDLVRIPSTYEQIPQALDVARKAKQLDIRCSLNVVNISALSSSEMKEAIKIIAKAGVVDILYLADSRGASLPEETTSLINLVRQEWKGILGYHGHDNIGFAAINTSIALEAGCEMIDGTIKGFGLGGGNTKLCHALSLVEHKMNQNRYQYEALDSLRNSIFISMPAEHSYLYYLAGQKNLAQLWVVPLLERFGKDTVPYLQSLPRKPYKFIEEVL